MTTKTARRYTTKTKVPRLLIVLGPTAVGKSDYAIAKALEYGSPVISCDSRQIYKEMTIGTAVPDASQLSAVKHYFIQTESVTRLYSAGDYERDAIDLIERLFAEGHDTLVMAGGSMMYIDAVCKGLDNMPEGNGEVRAELWRRVSEEGLESLVEQLRILDPVSCDSIELTNPQRVVRTLEGCLTSGRPFSSFKTGNVKHRNFVIEKTGLSRPREVLYDRIDNRVVSMMEAGLLSEARTLLPLRHLTALQTVGYRELFDYLDGRISLDEAVRLIQRNTRHYAKRQLTWWRRDADIRWIEI